MSKKQKQSFREAVDRFIRDAKREFRTDELVKCARARIRTDPPELDQAARALLDMHPGVFHDEKRDVYVPRSVYFRGGRFRVDPTPEEIEAGALILGHRLIPFAPYGADASECHLYLPGGRELRRKKISWTLERYQRYFFLLGPQIMMETLLMSDPESASRLVAQPSLEACMRLTVFDAEELYRKRSLKEGDALIFTVLSFDPPRYEVAYEPRTEMGQAKDKEQRWFAKFDRALESVFPLLGFSTVLYNQIAWAYFLGGRELLEDASASVTSYLHSNPNLELRQEESLNIIWPKGRSFEAWAEVIDRRRLPVSVGDCGSLEEILEDLRTPVNESVLEAYMRDALYAGEQDLNRVLERCKMSSDSLDFYDEVQASTYRRLVGQLWKEVRAGYSRTADHHSGKCRAIVLEAIDQYRKATSEWADIGSLTEPEDEERFRPSSLLLANAFDLLSSMNFAHPGPQSPDRALLAHAEQLADEIKDMSRRIASSTPRRRVIERLEPAESEELQLKVTLRGIDPPVWRRLVVSADAGLFDLHMAIQIAFGWQAEQDHWFEVGEKKYGIVPNGDETILDDEDYTLAEALGDDDVFVYIYRPDERWEHEVRVESRRVSPRVHDHPICTGGERACPPEGKGGAASCQELIRALGQPENPRHRELEEWLGYPFNPAGFDSNAVNRKLLEDFEGSLWVGDEADDSHEFDEEFDDYAGDLDDSDEDEEDEDEEDRS
ncbi:MAG: plasmid pRiA4b ORF-3 family protein [Acidobacteriota bacterium]